MLYDAVIVFSLEPCQDVFTMLKNGDLGTTHLKPGMVLWDQSVAKLHHSFLRESEHNLRKILQRPSWRFFRSLPLVTHLQRNHSKGCLEKQSYSSKQLNKNPVSFRCFKWPKHIKQIQSDHLGSASSCFPWLGRSRFWRSGFAPAQRLVVKKTRPGWLEDFCWANAGWPQSVFEFDVLWPVGLQIGNAPCGWFAWNILQLKANYNRPSWFGAATFLSTQKSNKPLYKPTRVYTQPLRFAFHQHMSYKRRFMHLQE